MTSVAAVPDVRAAGVQTQPGSKYLRLCFLLAVFAMLPAQIFRLFQTEALPWLLADYAGRIFAIGVVVAFAAGRWCVRQPAERDGGIILAILWIAAATIFFNAGWLDDLLADFLPQTILGAYPQPVGWLYFFDLTVGIALVALHEELVFRKLTFHALKTLLRSEFAIILVSAAIFGLYHWWRGAPNIIAAALYGALAMLCYRSLGRLWPVVVTHCLVDALAFA